MSNFLAHQLHLEGKTFDWGCGLAPALPPPPRLLCHCILGLNAESCLRNNAALSVKEGTEHKGACPCEL